MLVAVVCEKMHWTYDEYLRQPEWFVDYLFIKWNAEAERANYLERLRSRHGGK